MRTSRGMGVVALVASAVGVALACGGFLPIAGLGMVLTIAGGGVLVVALALSLTALIRRRGGTGYATGALALTLAGGTIWVFAFLTAVLWTGLGGVAASTAIASPAPAAQSAYLDAARPAVTDVLAAASDRAAVESALTEESLLELGAVLASVAPRDLPTARATFVERLTALSGEGADPDAAGRLFDALATAASSLRDGAPAVG